MKPLKPAGYSSLLVLLAILVLIGIQIIQSKEVNSANLNAAPEPEIVNLHSQN